MKIHIVSVAILAFAAVTCLAIPRTKRQTFNEPRLSNEIIPGAIESADETSQATITSTVSSTDDSTDYGTTKKPELDDAPTSRPGNKRRKQNSSPPASDSFSRVIDDIFNIPISVLRAVNTLISNAFGTKSATSSSSAAAGSPVSE